MSTACALPQHRFTRVGDFRSVVTWTGILAIVSSGIVITADGVADLCEPRETGALSSLAYGPHNLQSAAMLEWHAETARTIELRL
jgi:hypothetical protein